MPTGLRELRNIHAPSQKILPIRIQSEDGELFTCVKPTLTECRKAKDEYFKPVTVVFTPAEFKEKGCGRFKKIFGNHAICIKKTR